MRFKAGLSAAIISVVSVAALVGCSTSTDGSAGTGEEGTFTAAEVAEGSGAYQVVPLFAVPKSLPKEYTLAFANPSTTYPFFQAWSEGMQAAADFYGVKLIESDLAFKYEDLLPQYQQLSVQSPDAFGTGGGAMNAAVAAQLTTDEVPAVLIDGAFEDFPVFGVDDKQVGELAAQKVIEGATPKLDAEWADRNIIVVGITAANCAPCDARVNAAFDVAKSDLGLTDDQLVTLTPTADDPSGQAVFADYLTAHPNDVSLVVSYGDDPVLGAITAAKNADRLGDIIGVANGGSLPAREALRDPGNAGILLGVIDYQPFAEGWNWVEASIATLLGEQFDEFQVTRYLTADNVDEFYPND